jgi:hypothetical protein
VNQSKLKPNQMKTKNIFIMSLALFLSAGCEGMLDDKPNKSIVVPSTLQDLRSLMDNHNTINTSPPALIMATDEFITTDQGFNSYIQWQQRAYTFQRILLEADDFLVDWWQPYQQVLTANIALEQIQKIERSPTNSGEWDEVYGSALFLKAWAYYGLVSTFAEPYSVISGPSAALGIAPKYTSNINEKVSRLTLEESYGMILDLLGSSIEFLPETVSVKTRPSKAAGHSLLSRIYLAISDYEKALIHADQALGFSDVLMDYNALDGIQLYSFPLFNEEVIYYAVLSNTNITSSQLTYVEPGLLASYSSNDLRKSLFFKRGVNDLRNFFGSYSGSNLMFSGLSTNELLLTKAECEARRNNFSLAAEVLDGLLQKRYVTGTFEMPEISNENLLSYILDEREKELVFRGIRWTDLRRLNKEPGFEKTLTRTVNGETYNLLPNDPRWVYEIPHVEIALSNIQQNQR